jgi:3-oxoacyl-[acyl-carrier-protein] synthase-1
MRPVVVTGWGIVSPIGNHGATVETALRQGNSGICFMPEYAELGLSSQLAGCPEVASLEPIPRKHDRFMGDAARYAYHCMRAAIDDAALLPQQIHSERTGLIVGSGVGSPYEHMLAVKMLQERGMRKVPPYVVPRVMGNTVSANLTDIFEIQGISYGLTSACATGTHCIGHAAELIALGKLDCAFAGAAEEVSWVSTFLFDAMGALSSGYNGHPDQASRPFDKDRDGFVIAGGAGVVVLESLDSARARGATIHAVIAGYGACSGGAGMVALQKEGAMRAMRLALKNISEPIDYINAHGTSTPQGDAAEAEAIAELFGQQMPFISSTKGLTGHAIAAAGAHEIIYSLIMMQSGFIAPCHNLIEPDPVYNHLPLVRKTTPAALHRVMSNSFGFGGTNASIVLEKPDPR